MDSHFSNWDTDVARTPETRLVVYIDDFLVAIETNRSPRTIACYRKALRELDSGIGHPTLAGLVETSVAKFVSDKRKTSPSNARLIASVSKSFSRWLYTRKHTAEHRLDTLGVPKFNGRRHAFTDAELKRVLMALEDLPNRTRKRDKALVLLAMGSGMRSNEIRQLAIADTHIVKPLHESWAYVRWDTSKSQAERKVRMDEGAAAAIHDYIASDRPDKDGPLFLNSHGEPFTYMGWGKMFGDIGDRLEKMGIKGFGAHKLRHQWATLMARDGASQALLTQEGGWSRGSKVPAVYIDEMPFEEIQRRPSPLTSYRRNMRKAV